MDHLDQIQIDFLVDNGLNFDVFLYQAEVQ